VDTPTITIVLCFLPLLRSCRPLRKVSTAIGFFFSLPGRTARFRFFPLLSRGVSFFLLYRQKVSARTFSVGRAGPRPFPGSRRRRGDQHHPFSSLPAASASSGRHQGRPSFSLIGEGKKVVAGFKHLLPFRGHRVSRGPSHAARDRASSVSYD